MDLWIHRTDLVSTLWIYRPLGPSTLESVELIRTRPSVLSLLRKLSFNITEKYATSGRTRRKQTVISNNFNFNYFLNCNKARDVVCMIATRTFQPHYDITDMIKIAAVMAVLSRLSKVDFQQNGPF